LIFIIGVIDLFGFSISPLIGHQSTTIPLPLLINHCAFGGQHIIEFNIGRLDIEIGNLRHPPLYHRPALPLDGLSSPYIMTHRRRRNYHSVH